MSSSPHAKDLLSLLASLPDGITVKELIASKVPIPEVTYCVVCLIRTSLAYVDGGGRLKSLVPIREYIRRVHPPSLALSRPLRTHLEQFLSLWRTHGDLGFRNLTSIITGSLGNMTELLIQGLSDDRASLPNISNTIIWLNDFRLIMLMGRSPLMDKLANLAETRSLAWLKWRYRCAQLRSLTSSMDLNAWIIEGVDYFNTVQHPIKDGIKLSSQHMYCP
jgi:hypothetical protein